jgi:hypothetical protein
MKKYQIKRIVLTAFTIMSLTFGLLPIQAYAINNSEQLNRSVTEEEYQLYQDIVDELNVEYGAAVWLAPYSEYEAQGLPLPKAFSLKSFPLFVESMRENVVWMETTNLENQLFTINWILDPESGASIDAIPVEYCTNSTTWGVETMLDIISKEGYGFDVVCFVADRNSAFAETASLEGYQFTSDMRVNEIKSFTAPIAFDEELQALRGPNYIHTKSPGLGKSQVTGELYKSSSQWYWNPAKSVNWIPAAGYPTFSFISNQSYISGGAYAATCSAFYYGVLSTYDYVWYLLHQEYTGMTIPHSASDAAAQNGL